MNQDQYCTPRKFAPANYLESSPTLQQFLNRKQNLSTPKLLGNETPKSISRKTLNKYHLFPIINTPPTRLPKIINPFEHALTERLHLPLICSPSLFQRPETPQHSSTQFEWTIEEVSSLGPANVEPHETQFQATPDPDFEAKAQAAISSYFKEHLVVPSPVDCSLRQKKIILPKESGDTPPVKSGRRIRDGIAQTILTFPPILPDEIEAILKPFFSYTNEQQQSPTASCDNTIDYEARDASLRRKLFETSIRTDSCCDMDINDLFDCDAFSPPPRTPELTQKLSGRNSGSPLNLHNSFGSLSPISKELLSPLKKTSSDGILSKIDNIDQYRSTPDPNEKNYANPGNTSIDSSFNERRSRLLINNSVKKDLSFQCGVVKSKSLTEVDMLSTSSINFDDDDDDNEMQVSQLSAKSTSTSSSTSWSSSQQPDTPIRKRRSANRKNLSQSFSFHLNNDNNENLIDSSKLRNSNALQKYKIKIDKNNRNENSLDCKKDKTIFYRADSGFNEMTTPITAQEDEFNKFIINNDLMENQHQLFDDENENDISMICCSTPSRK